MAATQITNRRNENGVKSSIDLYRTIKGERFVCWSAGEATAETAKQYRAAGIRARFMAGELFVHADDVALITEHRPGAVSDKDRLPGEDWSACLARLNID